jgi:hypothetical protein
LILTGGSFGGLAADPPKPRHVRYSLGDGGFEMRDQTQIRNTTHEIEKIQNTKAREAVPLLPPFSLKFRAIQVTLIFYLFFQA